MSPSFNFNDDKEKPKFMALSQQGLSGKISITLSFSLNNVVIQ